MNLYGEDLGDLLAKDLRIVTLEWAESGRETEYIVRADELDVFVAACRKLHHTPGVNPHVKDRDNSCAKIWRISVASIAAYGPYWWAQTSLGVEESPGARTLRGGVRQYVFTDHELSPYRDYEEDD
jgi:hypothetical protein